MPPRRNPPPAPDPQIARNAHNTASLRGSHVQLMTCCWRIVRAVEALPKNPDEMTVKRWNAGLARELWTAIGVMGTISAMEITTGVPQGKRPRCRPVELLLEKAVWDGHYMSIDITEINLAVIVVSFPTSPTEWEALASTDFWWPLPQWWDWKGDEDLSSRPPWWHLPEYSLGPHLPIHSSELERMVAVAAQHRSTSGHAGRGINRQIVAREQLQDQVTAMLDAFKERLDEVDAALSNAEGHRQE